ncbi:2-oxoacid:acceptor oxidoreductase subunit alpha [Fodinibius saliphilus]|uniref:2-oxoacid:acceptor oxidoreductase subunit alpha n=1 Tax=Fodinibius saliphilus TaxID=1920650 RepID=UPI001109CBEB|nr:2-oxoacid:acceptor oxidoreductase subunit alpha [Fodinibius saliphilus]
MPNTKSKMKMRKAVVRFSGDSGDGMQLTGEIFSQSSGSAGNDLTTIPDFPAEIRAPQGSIGGVSSFQIQIGGTEIYTPGDEVDVLVALNPAALSANIKFLKPGGTIIADRDNFNKKYLKKAGYNENPLDDGSLHDYQVVPAPASSLTKDALKDLGLDMQSVSRSKNMFALGIVYHLFNRPMEPTIDFFEKKFKGKPKIIQANMRALKAGYYYAETTDVLPASIVIPPADLPKGTYRNIDGNTAIAWGALAAAKKSNKKLSLSSYPITPASEILHEIAARKDQGAIVLQAEDEIAAISAAIGASYAGNLSITSTSGPGVSLKTEAMGLAVIAELPLVVINVQRSGPSTGLPTKTEQGDLSQALYGRHGEAPMIVIAASSPDDCFFYGYQACRLAMEHMTPVVLLSDSYLASGKSPWRIPSLDELPDINISEFNGNLEDWGPYLREQKFLNRYWKKPGEPGFEHRIGGLEKEDISGHLTYDPENHEKMVQMRQDKVNRVAKKLPNQEVTGAQSGDLLVVGWGSSYGAINAAIMELIEEGHHNVGFTNFNYISPLPKNTADIFDRFEQILVCELNKGQFANYLRTQLPQFAYDQFNKNQAQPFFTSEIKSEILKILEA